MAPKIYDGDMAGAYLKILGANERPIFLEMGKTTYGHIGAGKAKKFQPDC